ncbi:MFS transporter [Bifidobacterium eulemuris]|uniref:MFS transporter n=1 Tax=Bifidobacterium eulemuris TaxID=1765219 RepID=A0A261G0U6_9BIFI|nr:glycoside-pentoside-hexuronide (GPH):cation symporter [Bifidobacterium eulemuris]OZG65040.1 symporter [Bifidobacterium eulemuris]QOL32857.1 MFS transporter [Bifidobacterium eulemuris]
MPSSVKPAGKLSTLTKFAFGMGDFWTSIGNIAMATYLTMFYTDVVHLSASMVASMLLVVRLAVAFWDLTVGILVDQTSTRWGKARPWMLFGGIAYGVAFLFLFVDPFGDSLAGVVYAWVVYSVVNIAYSTVNVSYASLTSLLTRDSDEKTQLNIFRMTLANVAAMLVYVLAMPVINLFGGESLGWSVFFGVIAVMIPFGYWFTFANTKERAVPAGGGVDRRPVGDHFRALARNKYWWLTLGLNFSLWIYNGIANGMAAYIAKYVLGNSNLTSVIGLATVVPLIVGLPFAGPLVARFGKRNSSLAGLALVAAGSLLVFVDPTSLWVFFVSIIVRMVGIVPMNAALNAMSGDVVEYGEWKTGVRSDGIVFSSSSFSMKVAMGVSSAAIAWILGVSGYDGTATVQARATVDAMVNTFAWIPFAMVAVMAVLLLCYDLDGRLAGIARDRDQR